MTIFSVICYLFHIECRTAAVHIFLILHCRGFPLIKNPFVRYSTSFLKHTYKCNPIYTNPALRTCYLILNTRICALTVEPVFLETRSADESASLSVGDWVLMAGQWEHRRSRDHVIMASSTMLP